MAVALISSDALDVPLEALVPSRDPRDRPPAAGGAESRRRGAGFRGGGAGLGTASPSLPWQRGELPHPHPFALLWRRATRPFGRAAFGPVLAPLRGQGEPLGPRRDGSSPLSPVPSKAGESSRRYF